MEKGAMFSDCRNYRYALWRTWDEGSERVMFIGLNPSTADETLDDPTIRRCIGYAKTWGYGGIYMLNLFAFRATNPAEMKKSLDPIGPQNDEYIQNYFVRSSLVVVCWGMQGDFMKRGGDVVELLRIDSLRCFGVTKNHGQPKHPLYLKKDAELKMLKSVRSAFNPLKGE